MGIKVDIIFLYFSKIRRDKMSDISVSQDFTTLCKNLRMSDYIVKDVQTRYHAITKRINKDFWFTDSETSHSFYVGSYGRGTAIYTSDIDIVVELPWSEYTKYDNYTGNGQSALLQSVKSSFVERTRSTSFKQKSNWSLCTACEHQKDT